MGIPKSLISKDIRSVWGSMSPSRHSRTYKQHSGQIFSKRNILWGSRYLPKTSSLHVFPAEQTTIRKALWGIHQQLLIYFLHNFTKGPDHWQWLPKCFSTFSGKVGKYQKVLHVSLHFLQALSESAVVRIKGLVSLVWNHSLITILSYKKTLYL